MKSVFVVSAQKARKSAGSGHSGMFSTSAPAPPSKTCVLPESHAPLSFTSTFSRTKPGDASAVERTSGASLVAVPFLSSFLSSCASVQRSARPLTGALSLSRSTSVTVNVIVSSSL